MTVPVPGSASRVSGLGVVEVGEDAGTFLEVITLVAAQAGTSAVGGSASIGNRHANLISIEDPILRAGKADLTVPVPGSTSRVGGVSVVVGREDAGTFLKIVSLEAGSAGTAVVVGSALIRDRGANLIGIEDPSIGAGEANLVIPIPGGTAGVGGMSIVEFREEAGSVLEVIALVAGEAVSVTVGGGALIGDGCAGTTGAGEPSLRAGKTLLVVPVPGSASNIGRMSIVGGRENAGSLLEVVSLEASGAGSTVVVGGALIGNGGADLIGVEGPSIGAGEADLVVPIPGGASGIGGLGVVGFGEEALSVLEVVSLEAGGTGSAVFGGGALVSDGDADLVVVEGPSLRAGKADLVVPIPVSASEICGGGSVGG